MACEHDFIFVSCDMVVGHKGFLQTSISKTTTLLFEMTVQLLYPILWLSLTRTERNRCVRWCLGWLSGSKLKLCPRHPTQILTKQHAIKCLNMHHRLQMSETAQDPPSLLLNKLPNRIPCSSHSASPWFI
jgi:hypothetical protein